MLVADRVKETTSTTGTGNITLAGAVAQFQTFNAAFGTNFRFPYAIIDADGVDWEVGQGYLSASTTLVREVVTASSNAGAAINLSAGTHSIFCSDTASNVNPSNGGRIAACSAGTCYNLTGF